MTIPIIRRHFIYARFRNKKYKKLAITVFYMYENNS